MRRRAAPLDLDLDEVEHDDAPPMVVAHGELVRRPSNLPDVAEIEAGQRSRRLPVIGAGVTAATGVTAHGLTAAASGLEMPGVAGAVMAGTVVATAVAVPALRVIFRNRIPELWRRDWTIGTAAAAGLVDAAVVAGPWHWLMGALLLGGTAAVTGRWNTATEVHLLPTTPGRPAIEAAPEPVAPGQATDPASVAKRRWDSRVAGLTPDEERESTTTGQSPIARGAMLSGREDLGHSTRWMGETPPGSTTFDTIFAARTRIAHALQVDVNSILIERYAGDESRFWFTLVTRDVLAEGGLGYPGPEYRNGCIPVGTYADGGEQVEWIAWEKGQGVWGGASIGQMGSGKTTLLELVMLGLKADWQPGDHRGCWRVWWGDGDSRGSSSNLAEDAADWFEAGPEGLLRQLKAFEDLLDARSDLMNLLAEDPDTGDPIDRTSKTQKKLRMFKPCPRFPGYYWIIPEFGTAVGEQALVDAKFAERLERALLRARKFGLGVAIDTQSGLQNHFANSTALRGYLTMVNAFCMRSTNKTEQYTMNGLEVSPGTLPTGGGYGYRASGRLAMFRTSWVPNLHDYLDGLPGCEDDQDAADAIRTHLPTRDPEASLEESQARMAARRAAARFGKRFTELEGWIKDADAPASTTAASPGGAVGWSAGGVSMPNPADFINVLKFPARPAEPGISVDPAEVGRLSLIQADSLRIIAAGRGGTVRNADIRDAHPEHAAPAVSQACQRLAQLGYAVALDKQGRWKSTALGVAASAHLPIATTRPDSPAATQGSTS